MPLLKSYIFRSVKLFIALTIWGIPMLSNGQNLDLIDSLKASLTNASTQDRFEILGSIGFEYRNSYPDSTIYYCTLAYDLGEENQFFGLSRPISFIGLAYSNKGKYKESLETHELAIKIAIDQADSIRLGYGYNNVGRLYFDGGDLTRAFDNFIKAKNIFERLDEKGGLAYVYRSLANIYRSQNELNLALEMSLQAYNIRLKMKDNRVIASSLMELGLLCDIMGRDAEAIDYLKKASILAEKMRDKVTIAEVRTAIAQLQLSQNEILQAEASIDTALRNLSENHNEKFFLNASLIKARILVVRNQFKEAADILQNVLTKSEQAGNILVQIEATSLLVVCYNKLNMKEKAELFEDSYAVLKEKVKNTDLLRQIDKLQFQLLIARMEQENKSLKDEQRSNVSMINQQRYTNIILLILVSSFIIISGVLVVYNRKRKIVNNKLSQQNEKITSQQRAIAEKNELLIQRNKELSDLNNEKDSLMGIVAHDLKSPLNRILGLTRLMEMEGGLTKPQSEYLQLMVNSTKAGSDLITDILDVNYFAQTERKVEYASIQLKDFLSRKVDSFKASAKLKNITLELSYDGVEDFVSVTDYLSRILDNLISNAIKFSGSGKNVIVNAHVTSKLAQISIKDDGPGFTDDDRKEIFQRFKKLSARPTGGESSNGLGLAIVKTLIDRLKGEIELRSETGSGAEFILKIPATV